MTPKPEPVEQIACALCMKEIPKSEATVAEAADYLLYFCGLDCYDAWQKEPHENNVPPAQ
ncbi:MAG: DUF3330 domain-containing protein [Betaproteobacteria bacterium]|nr:DUF3330 domain-containing protein [Betaproteobacteria bacterium]